MNENVLQFILDTLRIGDFLTYRSYTDKLNILALNLLNIPEIGKLGEDPNAKLLDLLIRICNFTYNNTDKDVLPIEDGIYDLLVEHFRKNNDTKFQVGADVFNGTAPGLRNALEFLDTDEKTFFSFEDAKNINKSSPQFVDAVEFNPEFHDMVEGSFYMNDIIYPNLRMNYEDFRPYQSEISPELISKRRHDTSHNHPELVGTLDKCKFVTCKDAANHGAINDSNVKILERDFFAEHIKKGIIDPNKEYWMTCELKYDGVSIEADCTDVVISARSRGDTGIGQASDMTPLFAGYRLPHMPKGMTEPIGVKFEAIIQNYDLKKFNEMKGYDYKNGRTAIVGLTGSSDGAKYRDLITLVPLQVENRVFNGDDLQSNRVAEIEFMNECLVSHGCPMRYVVISGNYIELLFQIKMFLEEAEYARPYIPFMYDGIVVSYVDKEVREQLGRENSINKYSMAVKFNPLRKYTTFRGYTYTVGQDGSITPMIHYDPVEFYGTIHPKSSGQSYARFKELNLAVGDIIGVDYVNDVMPYVFKPYNELNNHNPNPPEAFPIVCPVCGSKLEPSKTGKSIYCPNPICGGRVVSRMVNMFSKLNLAEFGEATIIQIGATNLRTICEIYKNRQFRNYGFGVGEAAQLETEIAKLFNNPIKDYELFGALGFTSIASKTWQLVFSNIPMDDFIMAMDTHVSEIEHDYTISETIKEGLRAQLLSIKGLGNTTVDTIIGEYEYFDKDIIYCIKNMNIIRTYGMQKTGKQIRATGFRNRELFARLRDMGHDADDNGSVTKSTDILLVPFEGYNQGSKMKKVSEKCLIIAVDEFMNNMDSYL